MPPLVSVLVTVYNRQRYLAACLESILASTWQDFEIIVVDDTSIDDSLAVARAFAARDPRIRVSQNPKNLGDYPNRNQAASLAKGKYLKYVDADDLIYPHSLALMVEAMEKFPAAGLALSRNLVDPDQPYPFLSDPAQVYHGHFLGQSVLGVGPSAAIIRAESFRAVGGFSNRQFVGDINLWLKLAAQSPVVSLVPALVWWRRHEGQQMALEMTKPEVLDVRFKMGQTFVEQTKLLTPVDQALAKNRLRQHHARRLLALALRQRRPKTAWHLFKTSGLSFLELLRPEPLPLTTDY